MLGYLNRVVKPLPEVFSISQMRFQSSLIYSEAFLKNLIAAFNLLTEYKPEISDSWQKIKIGLIYPENKSTQLNCEDYVKQLVPEFVRNLQTMDDVAFANMIQSETFQWSYIMHLDLNTFSVDKQTILIEKAIDDNNLTIFKQLFNDKRLDPNFSDVHDSTPLSLVAGSGLSKVEFVKFLLEKGANPLTKAEFGYMPIEMALDKAHQPVAGDPMRVVREMLKHCELIPGTEDYQKVTTSLAELPITEAKDLLFSIVGGEEIYNKSLEEGDEALKRLPEDFDAYMKAHGEVPYSEETEQTEISLVGIDVPGERE